MTYFSAIISSAAGKFLALPQGPEWALWIHQSAHQPQASGDGSSTHCSRDLQEPVSVMYKTSKTMQPDTNTGASDRMEISVWKTGEYILIPKSMNLFLALDIHTFSQIAVGQNLILYVFVSWIEWVIKSRREIFFALRTTLCAIVLN